MKIVALALAAALLSSCAQQDAALLVTFSGPFAIPRNADKLVLDVVDGTQIAHRQWCATETAGCPALPAQQSLSGTVTLVQSGSSHPRVKLNASLYLSGQAVGVGQAYGTFSSGQTVPVDLALSRP